MYFHNTHTDTLTRGGEVFLCFSSVHPVVAAEQVVLVLIGSTQTDPHVHITSPYTVSSLFPPDSFISHSLNRLPDYFGEVAAKDTVGLKVARLVVK
jgi:hypothetical protein